jgi:hypothetical protein
MFAYPNGYTAGARSVAKKLGSSSAPGMDFENSALNRELTPDARP